MGKRYNIGVDIGTNSVGYAVTDADSRMIKFKKKNMYGVRTFTEGQPAAPTRLKRSGRRRYDRREQRIKWLQNLVYEDVCTADENFFAKMKETFLYQQDKTLPFKYAFFNDAEFTDKDYYKDYPTIYHLRNELVNSNEKRDIRLVYLALHHIIKYRGNFLYEGQELSGGIDISEAMQELFTYFPQIDEINVEEFSKKTVAVLEKRGMTKTDRKKEIEKLLNFEKEDKQKASNLAAALVGSKADFKKLFDLETEEADIKLALSDDDFSKLEKYLDDTQQECFECMKKVYSAKVLADLLRDKNSGKPYSYISQAMVAKYNKHHEDLVLLKKVYRTAFEKDKDKYADMFRVDLKKYYKKKLTAEEYGKKFGKKEPVVGIYEKYIRNAKECDYDELKKAILKDIKDVKSKDVKKIIEELDMETFLPKLNVKSNGAIPYQLHKQELAAILENQGRYYPSLKENKDKILDILEFKIPYYVGPLSGNKSRFGWMIRKAEGKIYPWNFENIVDKEASAQKFIERMRNSCTYLPEKDVIPKCSLLYSEYEVRNEIKQIRIDGKPMSRSLQNDLYEELFKTRKTVKEAAFRNWLKQKGETPVNITGYQKEKEFASSLKSYIDFTNIFGKIDHSNKKMIEDIILWLTIFTEKDIIETKIKAEYKDITKVQLQKIMSLKYVGWSRLSRELLCEIKVEDNKGNSKSIMDYMRSTDKNFMQIISDKKLGFAQLIEEINNSAIEDPLSLETVQNLYTSPANKKGIWQTILVIKEIEQIMGCPPENIFVEFARSDEESGRTKSRYKDLSEKYLKAIETNADFKAMNNVLKTYEKDQKALDNRALFLYFMQNGKCLYTGKPLDINSLSLYEIDHIIPRSYIKDDSFDNLALVIKDENQRKGDAMLLDVSIRNSQHNYWLALKEAGLMSTKKFNNLKRDHFDDRDLNVFVARQLVETRQITKHVVNLLQQHYKHTNVVAIKAAMSHNLRQKYQLLKCRDVNDYHHAYDALLAAVIGRYTQICYPYLDSEFNYGEYRRFIKENSDSHKRSYGYVVDYFEQIKTDRDTGEVLWDGPSAKQYLIDAYSYKDCFISRKTEEITGEFYKQTMMPKGGKLVPLKKNLPAEKYGGYTGVEQAYYTIVEYDGKKGREQKLVGIPVYVVCLSSTKPDAVKDYLASEGYTNAVIIKDKIKKYQRINYEGNEWYLVSDSEVINARQLLLSKDDMRTAALTLDPKTLPQVEDKDIDLLIKHIIEKMKEFYPKFAGIAERLTQRYKGITSKDKIEKSAFLRELLKITQANPSNAAFAKFKIDGLVDRMGRMSGLNLDVNKIKFINTSVTGMFEN